MFLHVGRISEVSLISITMTTLSHAYFMQYGSLQSKFGYGALSCKRSCSSEQPVPYWAAASKQSAEPALAPCRFRPHRQGS